VDLSQIKHVGVKVPQFSFTRLRGADPLLGVEMASTGEVACYGPNHHDALVKGMLASQFRMPKKRMLFCLPNERDRVAILPSLRSLCLMGFEVCATTETAQFLAKHNVPHTHLFYANEQGSPKVAEFIGSRAAECVVMVPSIKSSEAEWESKEGFAIRRGAVDHGLPLLTNLQVAQAFVDGLARARVLTVEPYRNPQKQAAATKL